MHFHASLFRQIQVRIPDDGYQLSYRRGYDADQPLPESASEEATEDPLMPLIGLGVPNAAKEKRPGFCSGALKVARREKRPLHKSLRTWARR